LGLIRQHLQKGNIIIEVRDARAPRTTDPARIIRFPEGKVRCLVLTKADLADPQVTARWESYYRSEGFLVLTLNQKQGQKAGKALHRLLLQACKRAKTLLGVGRAVVVGLPNVGKSTLINRLVGRNALRSGDRPGVTKGESWCKINESLHLLDTPGVIEAMNRLVQEAEDSDMKLALMRVAPPSLLDYVRAARNLLSEHGPSLTPPRSLELGEGLEQLEAMARSWNRLSKDGEPDLEPTAQRFLREVAAGNWGRISLERPEDVPPEEDGEGERGAGGKPRSA
jgi:ribosome biogenesis GTPase A